LIYTDFFREDSLVSTIHAIFWDVGGVLLSNAWDHTERAAALEHFHLDDKEFHARHETVVSPFERGEISLDEYLDRTVFYCDRPFTRDEFRDYMFSLSQPKPEVLGFARALADSGKYFMGTINNESRELNLYRIEKFGLRGIFELFVSSCFVTAWRLRPRRSIRKSAASSTTVRRTWNAPRSLACGRFRCRRWNSCAGSWGRSE
jgi:FMN phosphatase YigB (HAD superfamily)